MKTILTVLMGLIPFVLQSQSFEIKLAPNASPLIFNEGKAEGTFAEAIESLFIRCATPGFENNLFKLTVSGFPCGEFKGDGQFYEVKGAGVSDFRDKPIQILDDQIRSFTGYAFRIVPEKKQEDPSGLLMSGNDFSVYDEVNRLFPEIIISQYGLLLPESNKNTLYRGRNYVHVFVDQFGNNIFSTIPQGISNRQYVVHVFYQTTVNNPDAVIYSVNQLEGEFQDALVINNAGLLSSIELFAGTDGSRKEMQKWEHREFLLSTSTSDIKFEVVRTSLKDPGKYEIGNQVLKTFTVKMSKVYHVSIDVGLVYSDLENPSFELVTSPSDPAQKVVKKVDGGDRGMVTAMATFYASPIIILERMFGNKSIPDYQLTGRNFLEDHKIYERIYPSVGVGFTDKTLENLFLGFNFEFARGGALFAGVHYGKVNLFNGGDGFDFENTTVSQEEFDLYRNSGWKAGWVIGVKLDASVIANLFKSGGQ